MSNTLYRCDGYVEEVCGVCPMGEPHKFDDACCGEGDKCERIGNKFCECVEYDRDPCGEEFINKEERYMAKIKQYDMYTQFGDTSRYEGKVIKVSELREWLEQEIRLENLTYPDSLNSESSKILALVKDSRIGKLNKLLAAIDTEGE